MSKPTRPERDEPTELEALWVGAGLAQLSFEWLWINYAILGGSLPPHVVHSKLVSGDQFSAREYNFLAAAINDELIDHAIEYRITLLGGDVTG
jgi:hypothetical protein